MSICSSVTFCPDCQQHIAGDHNALVAHREREHPPSRRVLAVAGIRSQEAHGFQDPPPSEED